MVMTTKELLEKTLAFKEEINLEISGNFCQRTGYAKIIEAMQQDVTHAESY